MFSLTSIHFCLSLVFSHTISLIVVLLDVVTQTKFHLYPMYIHLRRACRAVLTWCVYRVVSSISLKTPFHSFLQMSQFTFFFHFFSFFRRSFVLFSPLIFPLTGQGDCMSFTEWAVHGWPEEMDRDGGPCQHECKFSAVDGEKYWRNDDNTTIGTGFKGFPSFPTSPSLLLL